MPPATPPAGTLTSPRPGPTVLVAVHDGFYGCGTGAGVANRGFLRCLADQLRPEVRLVVAPVRLAEHSPEYDPAWHQESRRILARARVRPLENGTAGLTRFGDLDRFRHLVAEAARMLADVLPHADPALLLAFDVPFLGLAPHLPDAAVRDLVLIPRATARLHDPANRHRIAWEAYGLGCAAARGARIACISGHMREHLRDQYAVPDHALVDLSDGLVAADHTQPGPWPRLPSAAERGFLFAMGRAEPYKGFDDLLTALHLLTATGTPVPHLVLAAVCDQTTPTGHQQALTRRAHALHLPVTVLTHYRPAVRALLWHPALRAVIVPSRAEPFGRIPLEAYAAGAAPVVATTAGGLAETVRDGVTGYTTRPGDPTGLADAIRRALAATDADREKMRAAGRRPAAPPLPPPHHRGPVPGRPRALGDQPVLADMGRGRGGRIHGQRPPPGRDPGRRLGLSGPGRPPTKQRRRVGEAGHEPAQQPPAIRIRPPRPETADTGHHPRQRHRPTAPGDHQLIPQVHRAGDADLGLLHRLPGQRAGHPGIGGFGGSAGQVVPATDILQQNPTMVVNQPAVHLRHRQPRRHPRSTPLKSHRRGLGHPRHAS